LQKKIHFFEFFIFLQFPYHACFGTCENYSKRVHKKNAKKREKSGKKGAHFGEMERNGLAATCEHNYGAMFLCSWMCREHNIPH
jgi:hypothetical protein